MRINFFEEFPTKENLDKLSLVDFPCTVYIAAHSLSEFRKIVDGIGKKNIEFGYWPLLSKEEGYWFSGFSNTKGLKRIIDELKENKEKLTVMWDCELPTLRKRLFFRNLFKVFRNKRLIFDLWKNASEYNIDIVTAEYVIKWPDWLFNLFGIRHPDESKRIYMVYSSFLSNLEEHFQKHKSRIGVGVIAVGILGDEKVISAEQLDKDLSLAKNNVKEVTIFRLGGLNKEYLEVIKKYV